MAPPRLLLLDFDGVLAHYDRRARCRHLARSLGVDELKVHEVLFGANGLEARSDRGELDLPGYLQALRQTQGWLLEPRHFLAARQAATVADPAMLQLCRGLAPRLTLAVLSNNGAWFAEHVDAIVPGLRPLFGDRLLCSGALGVCKPEPAAYAAALSRLGHGAGDTVFIDDNRDNVATALALGLHARHFTGIADLRIALAELGLDPEPDFGDDDAT